VNFIFCFRPLVRATKVERARHVHGVRARHEDCGRGPPPAPIFLSFFFKKGMAARAAGTERAVRLKGPMEA